MYGALGFSDTSLAVYRALETEILEGSELAHQRMQQFAPKKSIWGMVRHRFEGIGAPDQSPDRPYLDLNLDHRHLFIDSHARTMSGLEYSRWIFEQGVKVRNAPSLPLRLVIIDGESAVMELDSESTPEEAELLNLLVGGATDEQAGASGWFELGVRAAQRGWVR